MGCSSLGILGVFWFQVGVEVHVKFARVERGHQGELADGNLPRWLVWDDAQQKWSRLSLCLREEYVRQPWATRLWISNGWTAQQPGRHRLELS